LQLERAFCCKTNSTCYSRKTLGSRLYDQRGESPVRAEGFYFSIRSAIREPTTAVTRVCDLFNPKGTKWNRTTPRPLSTLVRSERKSALPDLNEGRRSLTAFALRLPGLNRGCWTCFPLTVRFAEKQSALPDLNGGQVDLQSTALPV
jgi:hypothetical protein